MDFSFHRLKEKELLFILKGLNEDDCYVEDFLKNDLLEDLLLTLIDYNLVYEASDSRVLLTISGQKLLGLLRETVELNIKES